MKIILSPFSQPLRNGNTNAKNYPIDSWHKIVKMLSDHELIQVGRYGEVRLVDNSRFDLSMSELVELTKKSHTFISVDNFFPHMANYCGKSGIVLWGVSDPKIFGYIPNRNLLKSRLNLRSNQFDTWEGVAYNESVFVSPEEVVESLSL